MEFYVPEGAQFPSCYSDPQSFLDSLAASMAFQDTTTIPLFYNGEFRQATTGYGPPKTGDVFYGDALWYDPRRGGALYADSNFTSSLRDVMPNKGYRKFHGRSFGDIVPFLWKTSHSTVTTPIVSSSDYYFPDDVACAYNNWERKIAYTTTGEGSTTYNVVSRPWVYCDGYNYSTHPTPTQQSSRIGKVPNLTCRMIIGKGAASAQGTVADERLSETLKGGLGSFGGSMSATLNQMDAIPDHRHNFIDKGSNTSVATSSNSNATGYALTDPIAYESYATFTDGAKTSGLDWPSPNNVLPHQNLPPYFVVGFKMFVGYGD